MRETLRGSALLRAIAAAYGWFGRQWREGAVVGWFLDYGGEVAERAAYGSVFARAWRVFHRSLHRLFERTRLSGALRGSVFAAPFLWCCAALFAAPLLPTMAVAAICGVGCVSLLLRFGAERDKPLAFCPANKYIIIYALMYAAAALMSVDPRGSLSGGALMTFFVLFAVVIQNAVASRRQLDAMLLALVLSGTLVSAYGLYQYAAGASGASAWLDSDMFTGIDMRVYSTLGNPNVLSEYLLLVIPMSCAFIITSRGALARLFFVGTTGVMLACMLLTFARGGWLGLVVAAAIFLTMLDRRFILLIFAGLAAAYFLLPDAYIDRFTSIGNLEDGSTSYRLQIWLATVTMLGDYWFTGIGPGEAAFNKVYPLYGYNTVTAPHSHNLFLQVICDAGFGAFVAFMAILLSVARTLGAAFARESDGRGRVYQAAAAASLAGFLVQGLTDYSFYNYRVALTFWICVGLAALTARRGKLPERGRVLL